MELHMEVGGPGFLRFEKHMDLRSIDVYGTPSDKVRRQRLARVVRRAR